MSSAKLSANCQSPVGVFIDLDGVELTTAERALLVHPYVEGVIIFGRNIESYEQLQRLCRDIKAVNAKLVISMDQEGGRVQRLKAGVRRLPAAGEIASAAAQTGNDEVALARAAGVVMAADLKAVGVDLSFAPVLDVDHGKTDVVGDRSFSASPIKVALLADAFRQGMASAGMQAVIKHFPGHGWANGDTHAVAAIDDRELSEIEKDMLPFASLIREGVFGVMPAHVVYPKVDALPAGFSPFWLQTQLRGELGFKGLIFSDDLTMEAAAAHGSYGDRALAAVSAGCNLLLACNCREGLLAVLDALMQAKPPAFEQGEVLALASLPPTVSLELEVDQSKALLVAAGC